MPPHESRDPASIHDMLDSACAAVAMTASVSFHDFAANRQLYRAIEREVEIVGEAAPRFGRPETGGPRSSVVENRRHPPPPGARV